MGCPSVNIIIIEASLLLLPSPSVTVDKSSIPFNAAALKFVPIEKTPINERVFSAIIINSFMHTGLFERCTSKV